MLQIFNLITAKARLMASKHPLELGVYTTYAFVLVMLFWLFSHTFIHTQDHFMTWAASLQMMGFLMLNLRIAMNKSSEGTSANTLFIYICAYIGRLVNTLTANGYIPEDGTQDYMLFQMFDLAGFFLVCRAFWWVTTQAPNYTNEDTFKKAKTCGALLICLGLASVTCSNANGSYPKDCLWMFSCWAESIAMAPTLWLSSKIGRIEEITSHFMALLVASRFVAVVPWLVIIPYQDLTIKFKVGILMTIVLHGFFCFDFIYLFIRHNWLSPSNMSGFSYGELGLPDRSNASLLKGVERMKEERQDKQVQMQFLDDL